MRRTFFTVLFLFIVVAALYIALPYLLEYYIEKNSKSITGRVITLDGIELNPFIGAISFNGFEMKERDDQRTFATCDKIYVDISVLKCLQSVFNLDALEFHKPVINIIQDKDHFNYDDLLNLINNDPAVAADNDDDLYYEIKNITARGGGVNYYNRNIHSKIDVRNKLVSCPMITSKSPLSRYSFDMDFSKGGKIDGSLLLNIERHKYSATYDLKEFDLAILYPYVKEYMDINAFTGTVNASQTVEGNWEKPEAIAAKGIMSLTNIGLTDNNAKDLIKAAKVNISIDTLNVEQDIYNINTIVISKPYLRYELYKEGTNFDKLMASYLTDTTGAATDSLSRVAAYGNIFGLMANYIREISKNYSITNYKIDSLMVENGRFEFNDFTLHKKFDYALHDLTVKAERLNSKNKRIKFTASSKLNVSGVLEGEVSVDPAHYENMEISYTISGMKITDFNPYTDYFVAHPFLQGTCYYECNTSIENRLIKSDNRIRIEAIKVGKKEKNSTAMNLPVRLAVALLRDVDGNIDVEIPIEGNLDDPKYKLGKVIWGVVVNLLKKTVAAPGKFLARKSRINENFLKGFAWKPLQTELSNEQKKSLDAIAVAIEDSPGIEVELLQILNEERELDELAVFEAKKKYLISRGEVDTTKSANEIFVIINQLPADDSLFNEFLTMEVSTAGELTSVYQKSKLLIGEEQLRIAVEKINDERAKSLQDYLENTKGLDNQQFEVIMSSADEEIPYEEPSRCVSKFGSGEGG